ncbi:valine--tRNA ligase [Kineosporia sp. R_H_3]|uniref:valine--tRNA ligase n=1 Tax=Kineosporia sp. R_H_3 TaxID=1961848 RepID=UPI000B4BD799|nr:valine--tRNA ligase [Kineosporia sp. R_H_3]
MPSTSPDATTRPTTSLPPKFVPAEVEGPLYSGWVSKGYFTADPASGKPPFCIVIPPPNVTGSLHIGHALDHTIQDSVIRRRRMQGFDALWLPGMDHAGIATQNVVERGLRAEGKTRHDLGREDFVAKVWEWKEESGGTILGQMKRLGDSVDWSRERFTMDPVLSRAVQTIFKRLYDDDLIYRAERIINWCPRCHTALSDIEVEHHEDEGELVELVYGDPAGDDRIVVATTRVETMLGDTAIAVSPGDERYAHLVGRDVELPLTGRRIPVVADDHVDPEFGTGAVKVTPAHDPNDFEIGQRHDLPMLDIMTNEAVIANTGTRFDGLDRFAARVAVREALAELGRVGAEKRPYVHAVGHCSRCDTVVEPRLSKQWFVNVAPLAKASGDAVRDGRVKIHPKELEPRWFGWVDNMHDWCISRQLWWGHRIPVWYGPDGEVRCVGPDDEAPTGEGWTQDPDVLDTWFSSALWPFSTLGWPDDTADLERYYPTSVLVTGYDILFFWVARMMMFGLYAMDGRQPFDVVALHGLVRDQFGKKMSKSRGNVVDPIEWMDKYGADALRFTLARGANPGSDQAISEDWAAGSRNFCTKLWNATRFALLNGATVEGDLPPAAEQSVVDRWILSRLATVTAQVDAGYEDFQFAKTTEALYHFVWDEVCDWYLELAKLPLAEEGSAAQVTRRVLGEVFDVVLRLLHPVTPFVTEALWTELTGGESLVVAAWPQVDPARATAPLDPAAEAEVADLQRLVTEVRRFRAEQGLRPGKRVPGRLSGLEATGLAAHEGEIRALSTLDPADAGFTPSAKLAAGAVTVELDLIGAIDVAAERKRLEKDLATARKEADAAQAKLGNEQFLAKAPADVVAKIEGRLAAARADVERLDAQLGALPVA